MNDVRLERLFAEALHDIAPARAPDRLRTMVKGESSNTRPRRRWLALIKEPPMRMNTRLAVGSPTARVAAIAVATLLLVSLVIGASFAGARIFGAGGPIVVDGSGHGHYTTITEAVAKAVDGDEILVRPGTYVEAVLIEKDITLRGDGPVEDIVVTAPEDGPTSPLWEGTGQADPYSLLVRGSSAAISGLSFSGLGSEVLLDGGSPTLTDSVFADVGWAFDGSNTSPNGSSVVVTNGGTATVSRNQVRDGGPIAVFGGADPIISANALAGGPHIYLADFGDATVVEGNTVDGTLSWAVAAWDPDGLVLIKDNVITNPGQNGINLSDGSAEITGNEISGATMAAISTGMQPATVIGNTLSDNQMGVIAAFGQGSVSGNVVRGGTAGLVLTGDFEVSDNDVEGVSGRGIAIGGRSPILRGNRSCGNGENLFVNPEATPDIDDSNEICEDAPAE